jgi:hypothetical protein
VRSVHHPKSEILEVYGRALNQRIVGEAAWVKQRNKVAAL